MIKNKALLSTVTILTACFSSFQMEAKVIQTQYIEDVVPLIDEDTWFLVDLDNCFFEGAQALGHANWFYDLLQEKMQNGIAKEDAVREIYPQWVRLQKVCRVKPIEKHFVTSLLALQNRRIVIMGLTHRQPSVADSTVHQVSSLGFDFQKTAPSKETFVVPSKTPTLYLQGILFVGDYNKKNDIFESFLTIIDQKPKKVVFIDDKLKNVEELELLTQKGIEYIGVHYTAVDHATPIYSREVAEFQYKFLDQIMSNEAAQLLMENNLD